MPFLQEFIKLRTELSRELTHLELDQNLQYVANPWSPDRAYKEGMIVYYTDSTTGSTSGIDDLTWYRANKDNGPVTVFDFTDWDPIGASAQTGEIIVKDSNGVFNSVGVIELSEDFTVSFFGNTANLDINLNSINIWQTITGTDTIYYNENVLIGTDSIIDSNFKLTVAGNQFISGDLTINGNINGININSFYNNYNNHTHTIIDTGLNNYSVLYPKSNGQLADVITTNIQDGQVLTWDNTIKRWVNSTISVGSHTLGSHSDVSPDVSNNPLNNQILIYNSVQGEWINYSLTNNNDTGFTGLPFAHNHDNRYWTKSDLFNQTGSIINWDNIFNAPTFPDSSAEYVVMSSSPSLSNERVLTEGNGITITDNGPNNTVEISVTPGSSVQNINVFKDSSFVGTQQSLNFIEPASGSITYNITNNTLNNSIDIELDASIIAPVTSVNGDIGDVILDVGDINDVVLSPGNFPGPGTGTPFTSNTNILAYDDDIQQWVNIQASQLFAGISGLFLDDLLDVEIQNTELLDNFLLRYDRQFDVWVSSSPNDAGLFTAQQLLIDGVLDARYYTKQQLNTPGLGAEVHWDNITNAPGFSPFNHSHYLYQLIDVQDYSTSLPNDGDILTWNSSSQLWVTGPNSGGSGGFSTIINNSSIIGNYNSSLDVSLTASDINPLKFQSDVGIFLESDTSENIIKIGVAVDGETIGYNTAGELEVLSSGNCFNHEIDELVSGQAKYISNELLSEDIILAFYDVNGFKININHKITISTITLYPTANYLDVKLVAVQCSGNGSGGSSYVPVDEETITYNTAGELTVIGGSDECACDEFGDLPTSTPTDGTFDDGVFKWNDNTKIVDAFDDLNELMAALVPPSAPNLSDWSRTSSIGTSGKLSFDSSNPIAGETYIGADTAPVNPISVDGSWIINNNKRLGIFNPNIEYSGILNDQVPADSSTPNPAYPANAFGNADKGVLNLYLNGVLVSSADLESTSASIDTTSGNSTSGFILSASSPTLFPNGNPFNTFQYRTGTWFIHQNDLNKVNGYNYITAEHVSSSFNVSLDRYEFIIDNNVDDTLYSNELLHNLTMGGSKKISGIDYHTLGAVLYNVDIDNAYRNTYSRLNNAIIHTGNSNSYGLLLTCPNQSLSNCNGDELQQVNILNKIANLTSSGRRIINSNITLTTRTLRTVQSTITSTGDSIDNILLDNIVPSSTETVENFDNEDYRLNENSSYNTVSSVTDSLNIWDSEQSLSDGSSGHTTGLQLIDGKLIYPGNIGSYPSDFRTSNITNGSSFNDGGTGGSGRDYTSLTGERTFIRWFRRVSPSTANFVMNIQGSGGTFVPLTTNLTGNNIHVEVKGPSQTGWLDAYNDFATGQFSDGDGARSSTSGSGRAFNTNWGITIGTKNTANTGGYMLVKITVGSNFTGNFEKIIFNFS